MTDRPGTTGADGGLPPPARIRPFLDTSIEDSATPHDPHGLPDLPDRRALRPFVLTSGRVDGSDPEIGLETQVTARTRPPDQPASRLTPELEAIVALCAEPISVAEISARLHLHLGVAKILVGDLRVAGYLDVHLMDLASPHDPDTILRVMRGLRAIS